MKPSVPGAGVATSSLVTTILTPRTSLGRFRWVLPFFFVTFSTTTPYSLSLKSTDPRKLLDNTLDYPKTTLTDITNGHSSPTKEPQQQEEIEEKDPLVPNMSEEDIKFLERIQSSLQTVKQWEDIQLLQECRATIPWEDIQSSEKYSQPQDRYLETNAVFVQRLCRWFGSWMNWVNTPKCQVCGCNDCEMKTIRGPETPEEIEGQAKRVEVYYCPECNENTTTFPRYNKAQKLLQTQKGRCGEYSNLFGVFCRAAGLDVRLVLDLSDHLWTEIRLGDSWVMADSCEGIIDKASMYENGWGKEGLSYMLAISPQGVVDVTPRYSRQFMSEDFQTRRRTHTSSEEQSAKILQALNAKLQVNFTKYEREEWDRRQRLETAELQLLKQATEWTAQEKYGRGRISGSMAWKQSRKEAGKERANGDSTTTTEEAHGFEVEPFAPPLRTPTLSLQVNPKPTHRHDAISVAKTPCAIGESNSISVVVVDENYLGCILQSKSFLSWSDVQEFVEGLPSQRIVLMNGLTQNVPMGTDGMWQRKPTSIDIPRLGGWKGDGVVDRGIAFIGQVDAHPDWAFCQTLDECGDLGHEVELDLEGRPARQALPLRTEKETVPQCVAGRLPESVMPLRTQLLATEEQKRLAFSSFCGSNGRYCGYTTKSNSPIYLLDSTAYPFHKMDSSTLEAVSREKAWHTFHWLPPALVPKDDHGVATKVPAVANPKYDVPLESTFFERSLGHQLISSSNIGAQMPTSDALHNARLIGLYFSAHWCGPCRQFTPMLSEMYDVLKEHRPTHGLEIVFVSSDRDPASFENYFASMPWLAIPFNTLQLVKRQLNSTYGVRGIPSFVVLDAVTGQVVVASNESRNQVAMACRGGEQSIERMLDSWLDIVPNETLEILSMLEMSCEEVDETDCEEKDENPYLLLKERHKSKHFDAAARIKDFFDELTADGSDPTSAAAKAIGMVADEQTKGLSLEPGALNGKAVRTGVPCPSNSLDEAFSRCMDWNSSAEVSTVLSTASKYLQNASKEPWSPKYRTFKLSNKVADQITRVEGGVALLQGLGFEVYGTSQDFKATIPAGMDLEATNAAISALLEGLK